MWAVDDEEPLDDELVPIEEALYKCAGVVKAAAEMLGVSRFSLSKRIARHPRLQQVRDSVRESNADIAESILFKKLRHIETRTQDDDNAPNKDETDFAFKFLDHHNRPKIQATEDLPPMGLENL